MLTAIIQSEGEEMNFKRDAWENEIPTWRPCDWPCISRHRGLIPPLWDQKDRCWSGTINIRWEVSDIKLINYLVGSEQTWSLSADSARPLWEMTLFSSRPLRQNSINRVVKKHPSLFGIPFLILMVAASYGLTPFTQTRYDLHDQKVKNVGAHLSFLINSHLKGLIYHSRCRKSKSWIWIRIERNLILERSISLRLVFLFALSLVFLYNLYSG